MGGRAGERKGGREGGKEGGREGEYAQHHHNAMLDLVQCYGVL